MISATQETTNVSVATHDRPLAVPGLISYRYRGRYGWIMIGATDNADALSEARRSTDQPVTIDRLQVWNGEAYTDIAPAPAPETPEQSAARLLAEGRY